MVNLSFEAGILPDALKIADVNPLHKKESNDRNYRPIYPILSIIMLPKLLYLC